MKAHLSSLFTGLAMLTGWALFTQPALAATLTAGPMVGDTSTSASQIWIQTDQPAHFQIRYWPELAGESAAQSTAMAQTDETRFFTGTVRLSRLQPGTRYIYQLLLDGQNVPRDYPLSFSTVPELGQEQTELPELKFLLGSCYYLDDPLMKMLNISYGTGMEIFQSMSRTGGDMMFWLGDNIYFAPFDLSNRYNMNQRYVKQRSASELQPLLASMPQYAIWDDHDFGPNNSDTTFWGKKDTLDLFKAYWNNPASGQLSTEGTFFNKPWGDVEFLATDDRFHRDPDDDPNPSRAFFGREQLDWIKHRLKESKATFKLVVVGTPVLNRFYIEAFPHAEAEFKELMDFLHREQIKGVVFLSGDRHHTLLMKMPRNDDYPLYEFTNSPLTSNPSHGLSPEEAKDPWVVPDTLVLERNYGRLQVHGKRGARVLTIDTFNAKGQLIWSYDISQKDLGY